MGEQAKRIIFERTGLTVNLHLFRHTMGKIYLDLVPGGYEVLRRLLGHKNIQTTMSFYAGMETKAASRHFDEVVQTMREKASAAYSQRKLLRESPCPCVAPLATTQL